MINNHFRIRRGKSVIDLQLQTLYNEPVYPTSAHTLTVLMSSMIQCPSISTVSVNSSMVREMEAMDLSHDIFSGKDAVN